MSFNAGSDTEVPVQMLPILGLFCQWGFIYGTAKRAPGAVTPGLARFYSLAKPRFIDFAIPICESRCVPL